MMRLPPRKHKAELVRFNPVNALGNGHKCYQLSDRTVAMLLSQTQYLHWPTRWQKDNKHAEFTPAELDTIDNWAATAEKELMTPVDCVSVDKRQCTNYPLNTSLCEWNPADPFTDPNATPPGYILPPWYVVSSPSAVDGQLGDVLTDFVRFPAFDPIPPYDDFPRFRLTVNGASRVQIYFVSILAGSLAQIQIDGDLFTLQWLDLNRDIVSSPPETTGEIIWEHDFNDEGNHFIDVTIIPIVDDSSVPVRFGGGVRKFTICGLGNTQNCYECEECPDCPPDNGGIEDCGCGTTWQDIEDELGLEPEDIIMILDCYRQHVGDVKMNVGILPGSGWLPCDGSMHSKLAYPELYALLTGKTPETDTEFATPDLSLLSPMGVGSGLDALATDGAMTHTLTTAELPAHNHAIGEHVHQVGAHTHPSPAHTHNLSVSSHTHGLPDLEIGARSNSAAGSGARLMRSNATGTQDDITITQPNSAAQALSISSDSVAVNANTPFNTGAATGDTANAGAGSAHNTLHPVFGIHYYIFAGCAVSPEDCL